MGKESEVSRFVTGLYRGVTVLFWFSLYTYIPFLTPYIQDSGASYSMVGLILGAYGLTQTVLRIPLGVFSDRTGRRKPFVLLGLACSALSAFGFLHLSSPLLLLLLRGLAGVSAASWVAFTILFAGYFRPSESARALSTMMVSLTIGNTAGMFIGGRGADLFGPSFAFLLAAAAAIVGFALALWLPESGRIQKSKMSLASFSSVVKDRGLRLGALMALVLQMATFSTVFGFTPQYAVLIGASTASLANLALISSLPGVVANYFVGRTFIPRYGESITAAIGLVMVGIFTVAIPFTGSLSSLYLTQVVAGFGRGIAFTTLMVMSVKAVSQEKRATAMGIFQAVYGVGMVAGPVVSGIISDLSELRLSFVVVGIIALIASVVSALTRRWVEFPIADREGTGMV